MTPRLALIHGFLGTPASWDALRVHLPPHHAELPILLGHRDSASDAATFDAEVARIASSFSEPIDWVGYSLGGRVALGIAARHPQVIRSLAVIGASAGLATPIERQARRELDEARAREIETQGLPAFVNRWENESLLRTQLALPPHVRATHRARRTSHEPFGIARSLRVLGLGAMPWLEPELAETKVPMLFVAGAHDTKFAELARRLASLVPSATSEIVQNAGHDVTLEQPGALASALRSFWQTRSLL